MEAVVNGISYFKHTRQVIAIKIYILVIMFILSRISSASNWLKVNIRSAPFSSAPSPVRTRNTQPNLNLPN
jgi:hypothetical protein